MAEVREDTGIYPVMIDLAACLCSELQAAGIPAGCFCGVTFGDVAEIDVGGDDCIDSCGAAWVRLVQTYPSDPFPDPAPVAKCNTSLAYVLEIGVARCIPIHDDGTALSVEESVEVTRLQLADMAAMRRAFQCCSSLTDRSYSISDYVPSVVSGGVGGGVWNITVWSY